MNSCWRFVTISFLSCLGVVDGGFELAAAPSSSRLVAGFEKKIVTVEVTGTAYDFFQPWSRSVKSIQKTGVALRPGELLATAEGFPDHTQIRLQKDGRGKWWLGKLKWVDYHSNLAVVDAQDPAFWDDMKAAVLAPKATPAGALHVLKWRSGNLESRRADLTQFTVRDANLSWVNHLNLEIDTELDGPGLGEVLISGDRVLGIVSSKSGNKVLAIPSSFILPVVEANRKGNYRGLGYFDFVWQPGSNPASLQYLGVPVDAKGVLVIDVPSEPGKTPVLKPKDVLLSVDGFDVDTEGDYIDPDYGHLMLENLATRKHWAGDVIKLKIWREGKVMEVGYPLPKVEYSSELVPEGGFDKPPEYVIAGGLIFQPLDMNLLKAWGENWERRVPFRLGYYRNEKKLTDRPSRVVLTQVLPDAYNLGYQESRYLVVDKVNGITVSRLQDLKAALEKPKGGAHLLEFARGDGLQRIVLDASQMAAATQRVLRLYRVSSPQVIH